MSATIKKSSLVFNKCVYVLKHRKLGDFVLNPTHVLSLSLPMVSHHMQRGLILISQGISLGHLGCWDV